MRRWIVDRQHPRINVSLRVAVRALPPVLLFALLSGCSSLSDTTFTVFADPSKYTYYSCEQIALQTKSWTTREEELRRLMDRAGGSTGGTVVNVLAYQADYTAATEELRVLERTARNKNCNAQPAWGSSTVIR